MNVLIFILVFLVIFFASIAGFFGSEMLKKFGFLYSYSKSKTANLLLEYEYDGSRKPGMYNIVIRGQKPFSVLPGFAFSRTKLDVYGCVEITSVDVHSGDYVAVVSTYLGRSPTKFQFILNQDMDLFPFEISSTAEDQKLTPHKTYPPHWWQRLGFYG